MYARKIIVTAGLALGLVGSAPAGDLNPPAGPIGATMKPLDAIEPRTCISEVPGDATAVHRITQAGQYVLTDDVEVLPGQSGIVIDLPPGVEGVVSVDLNGFSIVGQPGSVHAVHCAAAGGGGGRTYVLMSTFPTNWRSMGGSGLRVDGALSLTVSGVIVSQCGGDGVSVSDTDRASISVGVNDCTGSGISVQNVGTLRVDRSKPHVNIGTIGHVDHGRIVNVGAHGVFVSGCDRADIDVDVSQCGQDGVHIRNTDVCELSCRVRNTGEQGVDCGDVLRLGISGYPGTNKAIQTKGTGICRVANTGSEGVLLTDCTAVAITDLECVDTGGPGIASTVNGAYNAQFTTTLAITSSSGERCGGNGITVVSNGPRQTVDVSQCRMLACVGDGLHVDGADRVSVDGWRDDDCDGDGIEVVSASATPITIHVRDAFSNAAGGFGHRMAVHSLLECVGRTNQVSGCGAGAVYVRDNLQLGRLAMEDYRISGAAGDGIDAECADIELRNSVINGCNAAGARLTVSGSLRVDGLLATKNGSEGLRVDGSALCCAGKVSMQDFHFASNGFAVPGGASGLHVQGVPSVSLSGGDSSRNAGSGITLADFDRDGRLDSVTCSSNGAYGVLGGSFAGLPNGRVNASSVVCDGNAFDGMNLDSTTGGEISRCSFTNNGNTGLVVFGNGHVVQTNSCRGNPGGPLVVPVPGNSVGPLVNELTIGANCNPSANQID